MSEKPPLGVKPRFIHEDERFDELLAAVQQYRDADLRPTMLVEWLEEMVDLAKSMAKR